MHLKREPTLGGAIPDTSAIPFRVTSPSSTRTFSGISGSINGKGDKDRATTTIPTPAGPKPSYLILNEAISFLDSFRILGRLVANVKCPLEEYTPAQVLPDAKIPGVEETSVFRSNEDSPKRQSTFAPEASASSSPGSSGPSSNKTSCNGGVAKGDADFARELENYKATLVFSNLPFTISSSATARITHRSRYSKNTSSLLTALLGISISSSTTSTTTYRLDSALVRTLSLSQHHLVWAALLGHDEYKQDIMAAVRRNGGKMFLVIGVKVARDAEVQKKNSREKAVDGRVRVDVGGGVGVRGLGKVAVGKDGVGASMGVGGGQAREVVDEGGRKERLLGDRAFAIEYREVRLKLKLEVGGSRGRGDKEVDMEKGKGKAKEKTVENCGQPALDAMHVSFRKPSMAELHKQPQELGIMDPGLPHGSAIPMSSHWRNRYQEEPQALWQSEKEGRSHRQPRRSNDILPPPPPPPPHPPTGPQLHSHKPQPPSPLLPRLAIVFSYMRALAWKKKTKNSPCGSGLYPPGLHSNIPPSPLPPPPPPNTPPPAGTNPQANS